MTELLNDNDRIRSAFPVPDPHGQAAMLLLESLLHGLIARKVITTGNAVEIVAVAAEVKQEVAADLGDTPASLARSLGLLTAIGSSLQGDLAEEG